jgi:hypothetical protein
MVDGTMMDPRDPVWVAILLGLMALMLASYLMHAGRGRAPLDPDYEPAEDEPMTLGDWRNEHEGRQAPRGGGWVECFCCGCPALNEEEDFPTCEVCGWDGDVDAIDAVRINFQHHGSIHAPEHAAAVSAPERTLALELAAACARVPEGEAPPPEFWPAFYQRLDALRRMRAEVSGAAG